MAVKSKAKTKTMSKGKTVDKSKAASRTKGAVKGKPVHQAVSNLKSKKKESAKPVKVVAKAPEKPAKSDAARTPVKPVDVTRSITPVIVRRSVTSTGRTRVSRAEAAAIRNATQYTFMKAPTPEHAFEVGDNVEVFCDHEKGRERVRGWIRGIVVQVDNKMVAVQFRSNVFLTDGWMVPDRILWYPLTSEHIRPVGGKKSAAKKDFIPDY